MTYRTSSPVNNDCSVSLGKQSFRKQSTVEAFKLSTEGPKTRALALTKTATGIVIQRFKLGLQLETQFTKCKSTLRAQGWAAQVQGGQRSRWPQQLKIRCVELNQQTLTMKAGHAEAFGQNPNPARRDTYPETVRPIVLCQEHCSVNEPHDSEPGKQCPTTGLQPELRMSFARLALNIADQGFKDALSCATKAAGHSNTPLTKLSSARPAQTKHADQQDHFQMRQTGGQQCSFCMKLHASLDSRDGLRRSALRNTPNSKASVGYYTRREGARRRAAARPKASERAWSHRRLRSPTSLPATGVK